MQEVLAVKTQIKLWNMHFIFLFSKFLFRLVKSYFEIPLKTQEIFMINHLKSHMPSIFLHFPFRDRKKKTNLVGSRISEVL